MDDNMNNENLENENNGKSFGSSEYYKKLYDDLPEDVAEMLIGTHPLMKKEISDELTHSIKIRSAKEKNLRAVREPSEMPEDEAEINEQAELFQEPEQRIVPSRDPVEPEEEPLENKNRYMEEYVGDITSYTRGLVASPAGKKQKKEKQEEKPIQMEEPINDDKSEDDITAEMIAKMLGGGNVSPVDETEYDEFELEEPEEEQPKKPVKTENKEYKHSKKKRRQIDQKDLEISNIEKQANLNELFREDDDYYDEKHSSISVARIVIIVAAVVVFAFLIYKAASLSGQVSKLNAQIETYKTMEKDYEQLKLDNLSLTEQVQSLNSQTGGDASNSGDNDNTTTPASTNNNSSSNGSSSNNSSNNSSSNNSSSSSTTYTVKSGDTYWAIAAKEYGNGSYYTKILSANGLSENDKLKEGMTLTIPAL
ncbi:MAG: LysM peptidoglycan-binding domain-containing protein [Candidatus Metalachnospira sp.]|nr:LysM peptidoglycan-binding domain-containing protein [Candidatus Metalachnospira sp.]